MKMRMLALLGLANAIASCAQPASIRETAAAPASNAVAPQQFVLPPEVVGATWQWISLATPAEEIKSSAPDRYTVRFEADGHVAVQADCNRGVGTFTVRADRQISFGPIALTRMMCPPESQSDRYARELGQVSSYMLKDGELFLAVAADSGALRFRRQP
jgi:para-nitrobenzyl esterase